MNPIIINAVGCHVCGVPAGTECIDSFEGQNGHGDRMDVFRVEAPYEDRLAVHLGGEAFLLDWVEKLKTSDPKMYEQVVAERADEVRTGSLWLTAKEIRALRGVRDGKVEGQG